MGVLIPTTQLGIRHRVDGVRDALGDMAGGAWARMTGPWPGTARQMPDGTWTLGLDPAAAPVRVHDIVVEPGSGREWVATSAQLLRNVADPTVDWVRVVGNQRDSGGTAPTDAYWVGR